MTPDEEWHGAVARARERRWRDVIFVTRIYVLSLPALWWVPNVLNELYVGHETNCVSARLTCWSQREHAEFALYIVFLLSPWVLASLLRALASHLDAPRRSNASGRPTTF